jgi:L,D-transpeptidase ErfK/SrfK
MMPGRGVFLLSVFLLALDAFFGVAFALDSGNSVIGLVRSHRVRGGESMHEIARDFDLGYNEVVDANPGVSAWDPPEGSRVIIPSRWILPDGAHDGVVINLAEMRLYHYMDGKGGRLFMSYPIGVGVEGFSTPPGKYRIIEKLENPSWRPPPSLRKERPHLPRVVGPGRGNPLGAYALRLSNPLYLIHGTNNPFGIGRRVSRGCIRLYPEDMKVLYAAVSPGTVVTVLYLPIKIGLNGDSVYIEVHEDYMDKIKDPFAQALSALKRKRLWKVKMGLLGKAVREKRGIPSPLF